MGFNTQRTPRYGKVPGWPDHPKRCQDCYQVDGRHTSNCWSKFSVAKETLHVPEEHLEDVVHVIRRGLQFTEKAIDPEVKRALEEWCKDEEEYLERLKAP